MGEGGSAGLEGGTSKMRERAGVGESSFGGLARGKGGWEGGWEGGRMEEEKGKQEREGRVEEREGESRECWDGHLWWWSWLWL